MYKACCCDERCGLVEKSFIARSVLFFHDSCRVDFRAQLRKKRTPGQMRQVGSRWCTFDPQLSLAMFTRSAQGLRVTKKGIAHQTNCELEGISTGTSTCSCFDQKFGALRRDRSC